MYELHDEIEARVASYRESLKRAATENGGLGSIGTLVIKYVPMSGGPYACYSIYEAVGIKLLYDIGDATTEDMHRQITGQLDKYRQVPNHE